MEEDGRSTHIECGTVHNRVNVEDLFSGVRTRRSQPPPRGAIKGSPTPTHPPPTGRLQGSPVGPVYLPCVVCRFENFFPCRTLRSHPTERSASHDSPLAYNNTRLSPLTTLKGQATSQSLNPSPSPPTHTPGQMNIDAYRSCMGIRRQTIGRATQISIKN